MRRLVVLLAVVGALVLSAGAALADSRAADTGERGLQAEAEPLGMKAASRLRVCWRPCPRRTGR